MKDMTNTSAVLVHSAAYAEAVQTATRAAAASCAQGATALRATTRTTGRFG